MRRQKTDFTNETCHNRGECECYLCNLRMQIYCVERDDVCFSCHGHKIGQNLYLVQGEGDYVRINVTHVIVNSWWEEKKFAANDRQGCSGHDVCGHYLQVRKRSLKTYR